VRPIRQFVQLPRRERWLLLHAAMWVAAMRLALWTLPFRSVRRLATGRTSTSPQLAAFPVQHLSWAVQAAGRRIPGASCLTQALALQRLLARAGKRAELRIGVAKDIARGFESHAWVDFEGNVVVGNNGELDRYATILALPTENF
jgi:hypothetical protein